MPHQGGRPHGVGGPRPQRRHVGQRPGQVPLVALGRVVAAEVDVGEARRGGAPAHGGARVEPVLRGEVVRLDQRLALEQVQHGVRDVQAGQRPGGRPEVVAHVQGQREPGAPGTQHPGTGRGEPRRVGDVLEHVDAQHQVELALVGRAELLQLHAVPLGQRPVALDGLVGVHADEVHAAAQQRAQGTGDVLARAHVEHPRAVPARLRRPPGQPAHRVPRGRHHRRGRGHSHGPLYASRRRGASPSRPARVGGRP